MLTWALKGVFIDRLEINELRGGAGRGAHRLGDAAAPAAGRGQRDGMQGPHRQIFYYFGGWGNVSSTTPPGKPVARSTKASYGVGTGPRLWS